MNLTEIDSSVYATMLAAEIDDVTDSGLKTDNPDVNAAIDVISEEVNTEVSDIERKQGQTDEEYKQMICERVADAYNKLKRSGKLNACFDRLDGISKQLGTNIGKSFSILASDVSTTVDELANDITTSTNGELDADGVADPNASVPEMRLDLCKWSTLFATFGGEEVIADNYKDISGVSPNYNVETALDTAESHLTEIDSVPVDEETAKEIVERIVDDDETKQKDVETMYRAITNKYSLKSFTKTLFSYNVRNHNYGKAIKEFRVYCERYLPILQQFKKVPLNVSDATFEQMHKNMNKVLAVFELGAYTMVSLRKAFNKVNTVLVDENVANEDVLDEMEKNGEGVSNTELAAYVQVYHKLPNKAFPSMGINGKDVKTFGKKAVETCKLKHIELVQNVAREQRKTMKVVAQEKLLAYVESLDESFLPKGILRSDFVKGVKNTTLNTFSRHVFTTSDHNLQSCLYDFVLDTKYKGTLLKDIHKRYGELMTKKVMEAEEDAISETDLDNVENEVATELVVNFLNKLFHK